MAVKYKRPIFEMPEKFTSVPIIKKFVVTGLHGFQKRSISFSDNRLILVGENGAGKTTVSRMLAYFLTCQWALLSEYDFDVAELVFQIDGKDFESEFDKHKWEMAICAMDPEVIRNLSREEARRFRNRLTHFGTFDSFEFERLIKNLSGSLESRKSLEGKTRDPFYEFVEIDYQMSRYFTGHVLYLPTYRRIEEERESFFEKSERTFPHERIRKKPFEIISFGMEDVQKLIDAKTAEIGEYSRREQNSLSINYLKKIIAKDFRNVDFGQFREFSIETVMSVLDRVSDDILLPDDKVQLANTVLRAISVTCPSDLPDSEKILCHYFLLLRQFDEKLKEREKCFSNFVSICNSYLKNKRIEYNSSDYSCSVVDCSDGRNRMGLKCERISEAKTCRSVDLKDLSSGEKQIVGLFSKLYLEKSDGLFVFIDEPELSLSIDWQRRLLPDVVASENCKGLFAATHSPFIFDNELVEIVRGINEF